MTNPRELNQEQLFDYVDYLKAQISTYRCALKDIIYCEADYETLVQIAQEALEGEEK